ncbi:alpha/beta hydrolase fold domain-containing protein [Umezawaea sp. Da 62-37]|uniref:alpha/beta hydrolase fold domain-containing protein n=1 Tax=Umezawaea sp. Da 62-37 TaxID=3075927 RepID=UPI0028F6FF8B|nr:alpha/beta hydrolase fold domain-containing protein [Umezawaea sp. Da 62-37]WNV85262.1 alpha/beta hydrolase fold domain-containing protein [Umezawaea sp. Da 62-37]
MPTPRIPLPIARALLHPCYRVMLHHRMPWSAQRALLNTAARIQPLPGGTSIRVVPLGDRLAERITVGPTSAHGAVLYLHGGGYTVGSLATHRSLAAHLARETHRPVYLLDYRLAPEHPYPAALHDAVSAFDAVTDVAGCPPGSIAMAGDSAGGGIALAAAQRLAARGNGTPSALALMSPWTNPTLRAARPRDLVVNRSWGFACAAAYLGDGDPTDPRYAPLLGTMTGLPPTYVFTSTRELLYEQCVELAASLRRAGVRTKYVESPTLWHAAQIQAGMVKEAAESLRDVGAFLKSHWSDRAEPRR